MTTPTPAALEAAEAIACIEFPMTLKEERVFVAKVAEAIDSALAAERERVAELVRASNNALWALRHCGVSEGSPALHYADTLEVILTAMETK